MNGNETKPVGRERRMVIAIVGLSILAATVGAILCFAWGEETGGTAFLAIVTGGLGTLSISPLSKSATAPDVR